MAVLVAGTTDDVDLGDRFGAVGQRPDRLRTADGVHLVHAGDRARGEGDVDDRPGRPVGGNAHDDLTDTGHLGGNRGHEHGRRISGPPTRHVAPGPVDRHGEAPDRAAVDVAGRLVQLGAVERLDAAGGDVEGVADIGGDPFERRSDLGRVDPKGVEVDAVELLRVPVERGVAVGTDGGEDRAHGSNGAFRCDVGPGQVGGHVALDGAQVETVQHGPHATVRPNGGPNQLPLLDRRR